jgi:hypothetical protein
MGEDLVGRTVTTGKRNYNQNKDMAPKNISLPVKPYVVTPVTPGVRDTPLDAGGSATPKGMK